MLRDQYAQGAGHGVYGAFEFTAPVLLIREPELLKAVAVKEFDSFTNHPTVQIGDADPIFSKNLFHLKELLLNEDVSAQAVLFFFAGFDTVSSALCLSTYVLSHHQNEQKRLYEEVAAVMEITGGKPTYEAVQGMKYLDAVVSEVLRLYPPAGRTDRQCVRDVRLPATASSAPLLVPRGQVIHVPIIGLHRDPAFWRAPDAFDPERFSDANKHSIKPFTYMPFGLGPRICIGQRFGLIEVKIALVYLLANFVLLPSAKAKYPAEFEPGFNLIIKGGFWCELKPR